MELGESTQQGAARETDEEAGAQIEMEALFSVLSVPRVGQVHLFYRARLLNDQFNPGYETLEARLFTEDQIPWDEIAFRTVRETLLRFFNDRRAGAFQVHTVEEYFVHWIDTEEKKAVEESRRTGRTFPASLQVFDQFREN